MTAPQGKIIAKGGRIFMAFEGDEPVGCVALIAMPDGGYEVAKMTVVETLRGSGLGRILMQRCIDAGAEAGPAQGLDDRHLGHLVSAIRHGDQRDAAHGLLALESHEDAAAGRDDLALRVVQHLQVLGLQGEILGDPGDVQRLEGGGVFRTELDDLHGRTLSGMVLRAKLRLQR